MLNDISFAFRSVRRTPVFTAIVVLAVAGIAAGIGTAIVVRGALRPFLFGVTDTDTVTYVAAGLLLFCVAAGASLVAAMPVLQIDPANTLRAE